MKFENLEKCQSICERIEILKRRFHYLDKVAGDKAIIVSEHWDGSQPILKSWISHKPSKSEDTEEGLYHDLFKEFIKKATVVTGERIMALEHELSKL